ncbi:hypothetical protein AALP_AA7G064300 [Arabis alpina]|uniref:Uncharacterized protein n=1 Tax=Arabis alpina TaxID=50452 RepID=A0A087GGB2_ARAAL|nr:hypothetical protein AALP_AA7G064300 [Arabis alpina]
MCSPSLWSDLSLTVRSQANAPKPLDAPDSRYNRLTRQLLTTTHIKTSTTFGLTSSMGSWSLPLASPKIVPGYVSESSIFKNFTDISLQNLSKMGQIHKLCTLMIEIPIEFIDSFYREKFKSTNLFPCGEIIFINEEMLTKTYPNISLREECFQTKLNLEGG